MERQDNLSETVISNEFATIMIQKVYTRNGERLLISSPKLGQKIYLDAVQLESLTWQLPEIFSEFLEEPYGPRK